MNSICSTQVTEQVLSSVQAVMTIYQYLLILIIVREVSSSLIRQAIYTELVKPWEVKIISPEYIHMGLVMAGVSPEQHPEQHYLHRMEKMLRSTISYSQGTPLHLVFISDQESVQVISRRVEIAYDGEDPAPQ